MGVSEAGFEDRIDLAAELVGGAVIFSNQRSFFRRRKTAFKKSPAIFIDGKYTDRGEMDGRMGVRRRRPQDMTTASFGSDLQGVIHGVVVDTAHFKGNYPKACRIEACAVDGQSTPAELESSDVESMKILRASIFRGTTRIVFRFVIPNALRTFAFSIFPDGGVARFACTAKWFRLSDGWADVDNELISQVSRTARW